jgi:hypothetical protein
MNSPDEVMERFNQWRGERVGSLNEVWALNLLLNALARYNPDAFTIATYEHAERRGGER